MLNPKKDWKVMLVTYLAQRIDMVSNSSSNADSHGYLIEWLRWEKGISSLEETLKQNSLPMN